MTNKRQRRHCWHGAPGSAAVATLAIVGAFLAPSISPASAAVTTTSATTTTTAVPGSNCSASVSGTALPRAGWSATTNAPSSTADAPAHALDGNFNTRFSTNEDQAPGLAIRVDLGSARAFDQLAMRAPSSPNDYARGYDVLVSANNSSWATVATCTGTANPEVVSFPTQTAQYVRVVLTAASATNWWSIDEFDLYSSAPAPTTTTAVPGSNCSASVSGTALPRTGWSATTNAPSSTADAPANALDGNFKTRFSTNEDQAPGLAFHVDLGSARAFDEVAMRAPSSPNDYARGYDVLVSANNSTWATVATCTGTANPEVVSFPTQTAQYVRVVLTAASATNWWSIDEFDLYSSAPAPTTTSTTTLIVTTTTTSLSSSANPAPVGQALTYTVKVAPVPNGGTVNFFANGSPIAGCAKVALSTATGEATCATRYSSSGHFGVQAFYSGDARFKSSGSAVYVEVINLSLPAPGYWLATGNGRVYGSGAAPSLGGVTTSATSARLWA